MKLFSITLIVGIAILGNSYAKDHERRGEGFSEKGFKHQNQQIQQQQSAVTTQVQKNQPFVTRRDKRVPMTGSAFIQKSNQPAIQSVQGIHQPIRTQRKEFRNQPTVEQFQIKVQPREQRTLEVRHDYSGGDRNRRDTTRQSRDHHKHDGSGEWRHHQGNNSKYYYGGSLTIYPFFGYPNLSVPYDPYSTRVYPNRYFICYTIDQTDEESFHVSCPYGAGWYSTSPEYETYQYRTAYRPEYICPEYGADKFVEFSTNSEANAWSNAYCERWIDYENDSDDEY